MKPLNRDLFLAAASPQVREFTPPALSQPVRIRKLTGKRRDEFRALVADGDKSLSFFEAAVAVTALVGDDNTLLFTQEDIPLVRESLDSLVISEIAAEALQFNKIGPAAEEKAAKN